jgi:hypothetical protein
VLTIYPLVDTGFILRSVAMSGCSDESLRPHPSKQTRVLEYFEVRTSS